MAKLILPHAILKIRSEISKACRDFMEERDFTLIDAPIFTPAACEGTSTLFETDYFDQKAYLTQSGQLYMEAAAMAFGKRLLLWSHFVPKKSKTRRHLTEIWMIEPEMAFCDLKKDMEAAEEFVYYILKRVLDKTERGTQNIRARYLRSKITLPFPRLSHYRSHK